MAPPALVAAHPEALACLSACLLLAAARVHRLAMPAGVQSSRCLRVGGKGVAGEGRARGAARGRVRSTRADAVMRPRVHR